MKLVKTYDPKKYESEIYELWERELAFEPTESKTKYSIVVPPPNANANLHIGHALCFALQDIAARYHRSIGESVLFVPGADHAGFETQVVFERHLAQQGKSRFDYSKEELYTLIYDFVANNRRNFEGQIKKLGASVDWAHFVFSLDDKVVKLAYETFQKMLSEGLAYRSKRLVNYCTFHGTGFADIEVSFKDEQGFLYEIRYPLVDGEGELVVATSRPETLLGDTAIAVNPKDSRYTKYIGKTARVPLTNREVPIIADDFVDVNFGTGAVKITPAHDFNDFEVGQKHDLPLVVIIGTDGRITSSAPAKYRGLDVSSAREEVITDLRDQGLLVNVSDYTHSVGHCYKCDTIIEPLFMDQWYVNVQPLAKKAIQSLNNNEIIFHPKIKKQHLINYLTNIKDWNISRQIAWGIPIPAFQNQDEPDDWIYSEEIEEDTIVVNNRTYVRDSDVFDTWFSSSSWPYATLNFPEGEDYKDYYPLSLMETGTDLLAPWISRMLMLGLYRTNKIPFKEVYFNGLVTFNGQKMSKSKGNVIDPMTVVDQFGSDALRIGLVSGSSAGSNFPFSNEKVIGGRNFCNKLWNIARFVESSVSDFSDILKLDISIDNPADEWIIARYQKTKVDYQKLMDQYRYSEALEVVYKFVWNDFADWYIELSKIKLNQSLLAKLLIATLILVHPFAPFVSETIYQTLQIDKDSLLANQPLLDIDPKNHTNSAEFDQIISLVRSIRSVIKNVGADDVILHHQSEPLITKFSDIIIKLSGVKNIEDTEHDDGVAVPDTNMRTWLIIPRNQIIDYLKLLDKKISQTSLNIQKLEARLNNPNYSLKAPSSIIQESQNELEKLQQSFLDNTQEKDRFKAF